MNDDKSYINLQQRKCDKNEIENSASQLQCYTAFAY